MARSKQDHSVIPNAPLAQALHDIGIRVAREKCAKTQTCKLGIRYKTESRIAGMSRFVAAVKDPASAISKALTEARSSEGVVHMVVDNDNQFCGGTFRELTNALSGKADMKNFLAARAELEKTGIERRIKTRLAELFPRRKRRMSEHDGEWSYDRRWEVTPFQAIAQVASPTRTLQINCRFAARASVSAAHIAKYGAMAWAIIDLIEGSGVSVEVNWLLHSNGVGRSYALETDHVVNLKRAGEYLAPSLLAGLFTPNFYRRAAFGLEAIAPELEKIPNRSGLCFPQKYEHPIRFADGALFTSDDLFYASADQIEREILAAIGAAPAARGAA